MAKAVSLLIGGNKQDVLAGTTMGVLPNDAASYDVEVSLFKDVDANTNATLLMDGSTVLENARLNTADSLALRTNERNIWVATNTTAPPTGTGTAMKAWNLDDDDAVDDVAGAYKQGQGRQSRYVTRISRDIGFNGEPKGNAPIAQFNAPANAKLTLNIQGSANDDEVTSVYAQAFPSTSQFVAAAQGHQLAYQENRILNELDVFQGTPAGSTPNNASLWRLDVECAQVIGYYYPAGNYDQLRQDAVITLLVDSDTICEQFVLPMRTEMDYPNRERDLMVSALVTGGSKITCNVFKPTPLVTGLQVLMRAFLTPVVF